MGLWLESNMFMLFYDNILTLKAKQEKAECRGGRIDYRPRRDIREMFGVGLRGGLKGGSRGGVSI